MIDTDFKTQLVDVCKQTIPDMKLLYLFGSYASNQAHKSSDIDIAILPIKKLSTVTRWEMQQTLAEKLQREVDLIDFLSASTVMQKEIISKGICLYDDNQFKDVFEMQVMSMYQHLNEERSELLTAFKGVDHG